MRIPPRYTYITAALAFRGFASPIYEYRQPGCSPQAPTPSCNPRPRGALREHGPVRLKRGEAGREPLAVQRGLTPQPPSPSPTLPPPPSRRTALHGLARHCMHRPGRGGGGFLLPSNRPMFHSARQSPPGVPLRGATRRTVPCCGLPGRGGAAGEGK